MTCQHCESANCYIEHDGWLTCRSCALLTAFLWDAVPDYKVLKTAILHHFQDKAELGTPDALLVARINEMKLATFWLTELREGTLNLLETEPVWREYARYYNFLIKLKHG